MIHRLAAVWPSHLPVCGTYVRVDTQKPSRVLITMPVRSSKTALAPDFSTLDERAARAWTERMAVTALGGGCYRVETESDREYTVDVPGRRCTCPDHRYRGEQCKHLRRVAIEITRGEVPPPGKRRADCASCGREAFVPEPDDPPLCTECRLEPGDVVVDRNADDRLLVKRVLPDRADEYVIPETTTSVADHPTNEGYPADDIVVEVVYLADALRRSDPKRYAFPHSRLRRVDDATVLA